MTLYIGIHPYVSNALVSSFENVAWQSLVKVARCFRLNVIGANETTWLKYGHGGNLLERTRPTIFLRCSAATYTLNLDQFSGILIWICVVIRCIQKYTWNVRFFHFNWQIYYHVQHLRHQQIVTDCLCPSTARKTFRHEAKFLSWFRQIKRECYTVPITVRFFCDHPRPDHIFSNWSSHWWKAYVCVSARCVQIVDYGLWNELHQVWMPVCQACGV